MTSPHPTPIQNPHGVTPGDEWRDNKRGVHLVVDALQYSHKTGKWYALVVRGGTGRRSTILLSRFHGGAKTGYSWVSRGKMLTQAVAAG